LGKGIRKDLIRTIYNGIPDPLPLIGEESPVPVSGGEKIIGTSSYLSYYNIGVIFEVLGNCGQALSYYEKCVEYKPAYERINEILQSGKVKKQIQELIERGDLVKAKYLLNIIENYLKDDPEIYSIKAVIFMLENKLKEARMTLQQGLQIFCDDEDLLYNLEYLNSIEKASYKESCNNS